jgi:GNAT superfamily N-acetyltransferase
VPRTTVTIRTATSDDLEELLGLHDELLAAGPRRLARPMLDGDTAREKARLRYAAAMDAPDARMVVAVEAGRIIGMALLAVTPGTSLVEGPVLHMEHVCVGPAFRRRGAGRALVAAAAAWADEQSAETVSVQVFPTSRESNRFYARLGFAPVAIVRMAPTASLRRRLGPELPAVTTDRSAASRRLLRLDVARATRRPPRRRTTP